MVVLVDTNVIIDYLITRKPFYEASAKVIEKCADKEITGYIAFEDCLQDRCAVGVNAEYIVTRNTMDFSHSEVKAVLPEDFLKIYSNTIS